MGNNLDIGTEALCHSKIIWNRTLWENDIFICVAILH